jgi:Arc/MetJ-type ribon-helix-helix transcriptional regulator
MAKRRITIRLEESEIARLDAAVAAGAAPNRSAAIALAIGEWLDRHDRVELRHERQRLMAIQDAERGLSPDEAAILAGAAHQVGQVLGDQH